MSELGCAGAKAKGKIPRDAFTRLRTEIVPLEQPAIAGVMVEAIVRHYDVCGNCGTERCTRAELLNVPVAVLGLPGGDPPRLFNPHPPRKP